MDNDMYLFITVTFPMDMIKTRLQIQGQGTSLNKSVISQDASTKLSVKKVYIQGQHRGVLKTGLGIGKKTLFLFQYHIHQLKS